MRRGFRDIRETKRVERNLPVFPEEIFPDEIVDKDGADDLPDEIDFSFFDKMIENGVKPDPDVNLQHEFILPNEI